ncbi:MAG: hypothetical protein ABFD12_01015 [Syntrophorhabdus sp.]
MIDGTVFDLEESGKGAWFDMEGGGRVQLRPIPPSVLKDIRKQTVTKKVEYKRIEGKAERFEVEVINNDLQDALFWDYCIVSWEKVLDANGTPIPCTKENKLKLMTLSLKFTKIVGEGLKTLTDDEAGKAAELEKN